MKITSIICFLFGALYSFSQTSDEVLKSPEGIVNEALRLISVKQGVQVDTVRLRNLFLDKAHFTVNQYDKSGGNQIHVLDLDFFIKVASEGYKKYGFVERELWYQVEEYNGIAQVFQSYEAKQGSQPAQRGINSYQLVWQNNRWWIANIMWVSDQNGKEVPKRYLDKE